MLQRMLKLVPEILVGDRKSYEAGLYRIYGRNYSREAYNYHSLKLKKIYLILLSAVFLLGLLAVIEKVSDDGNLDVGKDGRAYILRPSGKEATVVPVKIQGKLESGRDFTIEREIRVYPKGYVEAEKKDEVRDESQGALDSLDRALFSLGKSTQGERLKLPYEFNGIESLSYEKPGDYTSVYIGIIFLIIFGLVYVTRFDSLKKKERKFRGDVERELPGFINQLVLMMNAGLVFTSAFDYVIKEGKDNYFYQQLEICRKESRETGQPLTEALRDFAERCENREFMRVVNVIIENQNRGSNLNTVLENEGRILEFKRKKDMESKGQSSELLMTAPLALQLFSLILITLAPAILQMSG